MIRIFGQSGCTFCERAKDLAEQFNLSYEYINLNKKEEAIPEFRSLFPDAKTVPQIIWDDMYIGGYESFYQELKERGYLNE